MLADRSAISIANSETGHGTAGMMAGQRGWLLGSQPALRAM
jgi:hypothetical protein